jgi:predicted transcriptional regulator
MFQFLIKKNQMKHVAFLEIEIFFISILKKFMSSHRKKKRLIFLCNLKYSRYFKIL